MLELLNTAKIKRLALSTTALIRRDSMPGYGGDRSSNVNVYSRQEFQEIGRIEITSPLAGVKF